MSKAFIVIAAILSHGTTVFAAESVNFSHDILPILQQHCVKCHTNGRYEGAISFDTREAMLESGIAEPGSSSDSSLIERVTTDDSEIRMPLKASPLSAEEIEVLRRWVDDGLPWQPGFTFKKSAYDPPLKPRRPELPGAETASANPIDRIIGAYWKEHRVSPPKLLSDRAFCRRASLDLTGLLPTIDELAAFEMDTAPDKRSRLVRQLLDDRTAYADHWLTFWNDLLRNDYAGTGYVDEGRRQITRWLYRALVENKPYDEFVRELVNPNEESEGFANGFVWRGQVNASQRPELQYAQNVGQVFLGVNLKCASCHDSFIDNWKLTDSYGLAAIVSNEPLEIHRCDVPTGKFAEPFFLFSDLGRVDPLAPRKERLAMLARLMTTRDNGRLTRTIVNRLWDRLMGRGIVYPVDALSSQPWSEDLLDFLAADLADRGYDLKQTLEFIATSQVYGSESVAWDPSAPVDEFVFKGPAPKRMTAEEFVDAIWQITNVGPEESANDAVFGERHSDTNQGARRLFVRASLVESTPLMRSLGRPNREQVVTSRPVEMTTLEAIEMSNGAPLAELLRQGAERIQLVHPEWSSEVMSRHIFESAISRSPTEIELAWLMAITNTPSTSAGVEDALWCVVLLPEFQIVR